MVASPDLAPVIRLPAPLSQGFFARPAETVAPELIGTLLVRHLPDGTVLRGLIVETEAYCQSEPACHGHRRRTHSNDTLFGEPGRFYVYLTYGLHHCVNVVTGRKDWANGVLLRAVALPGEPERLAAGPALLARRFGLDRALDGCSVAPESGVWLAPVPPRLQGWLDQCRSRGEDPLCQCPRIGISSAQELPWRWYLRASRSVSRRVRGDRRPPLALALDPAVLLDG
ncbi:DNA-3-methyladenine glycosylase [Synechococcus sp. CS-1328]|uniref:DNA-3-methyladenine glycosylase n=1 Tax=Synechococcus sp. CS-1328 TaxID=2847976 RepID=UPI00223C4306|nr:DNA-3-methyladenine glycosylase [Synechococcus sp. CS-1328]MCT0224526.1 DNA-3-methyladenine glycosylase [Synechococcus sp. CS-1328]